MKKVLIVSQNPFQTMTAIIMRKQQLHDCACDIVITDRSSDMETRAEQIRRLGIFCNVYFVHTMVCWNNLDSPIHHIRQSKCILLGCHLDEMEAIPGDYDEIYTLAVSCVVTEMIKKEHRCGKEPDIYLVEEGYGSYTSIYRNRVFGSNHGRAKVWKLRSRLAGEKTPPELIKGIYLYLPELYAWDIQLETKRILRPDFDAYPELKEQINFVFRYNGEARFFENKVTFFEGADFQDTGDNRDLELIVGLAEMIGKDNVIVKLHPRTQVNRFEQYGITTADKLGMRQGVPWEVIVMNMETNANCVFVTVNSGAVINYSFLFDKGYRTVLMIKCLGGSGSADDGARMQFLERYAKSIPEVLALPESREELYALITQAYCASNVV